MKNNLQSILNQRRSEETAEERMKKFISHKNQQRGVDQEREDSVVESHVKQNTSNESAQSETETVTPKDILSLTIADTQNGSTLAALQALKTDLEEKESSEFAVSISSLSSKVDSDDEVQSVASSSPVISSNSVEDKSVTVDLSNGIKIKEEIEETETGVQIPKSSIPNVVLNIDQLQNNAPAVVEEETTEHQSQPVVVADDKSVKVELVEGNSLQQENEITEGGVEVSRDSIPSVLLNVNALQNKAAEPEVDSVKEETPSEAAKEAPTNRIKVKLHRNDKPEPTQVQTDGGVSVNEEDIPKKVLNVNGASSTTAQPASTPAPAAKKDSEPKKPAAKTQSTPKKTNSPSKKKSKNLFFYMDKLLEADMSKFFKIAAVTLFAFFILLVVFSVQKDSSMVNTESKYIPQVFKDLVETVKGKVPDEMKVNKETATNQVPLSIQKQKAKNEGKPANFYDLQDFYVELQQSKKEYLSYKESKNAVIFDQILSETSSDNGILMGWAIESSNSDDLKSAKSNESEIRVVIETLFNGKESKDFVNQESNESNVKDAIKRLLKSDDFKVHRLLVVM